MKLSDTDMVMRGNVVVDAGKCIIIDNICTPCPTLMCLKVELKDSDTGRYTDNAYIIYDADNVSKELLGIFAAGGNISYTEFSCVHRVTGDKSARFLDALACYIEKHANRRNLCGVRVNIAKLTGEKTKRYVRKMTGCGIWAE